MNVLYIGDIMAEPGITVVEETLPEIKDKYSVDLVIAQAENVTGGRGINQKDYEHLKSIGIDFFTGGNWSIHNKEIYQHLDNPNEPIIRPANYPAATPGKNYKYLDTAKGKVLVVSLLGAIVGKDSEQPLNNPLKTIDNILDANKDIDLAATIVNFHGDYSSEKVIIGHYLDGQVSVVVGDHWHVPTADARVLPKGTAHVTDVGMCGSLDSSLGVSFSSVIPRWREGVSTKNQIEHGGAVQFNAVLVKIRQDGLSDGIEHIRITKSA